MAKQTWIKDNGVWEKVKSAWNNINGVWKKDVMPKGVVSGNWKEFMEYYMNYIYVTAGNHIASELIVMLDNLEAVMTMNFARGSLEKALPDGKGGIWVVAEYDSGALYLNKYNESGKFLFQKSLGSNRFFDDLCVLSNGDAVVARYNTSTSSGTISKYSVDGDFVWSYGYFTTCNLTRDENNDIYAQVGASSSIANRTRLRKFNGINGELMFETGEEISDANGLAYRDGVLYSSTRYLLDKYNSNLEKISSTSVNGNTVRTQCIDSEGTVYVITGSSDPFNSYTVSPNGDISTYVQSAFYVQTFSIDKYDDVYIRLNRSSGSEISKIKAHTRYELDRVSVSLLRHVNAYIP